MVHFLPAKFFVSLSCCLPLVRLLGASFVSPSCPELFRFFVVFVAVNATSVNAFQKGLLKHCQQNDSLKRLTSTISRPVARFGLGKGECFS